VASCTQEGALCKEDRAHFRWMLPAVGSTTPGQRRSKRHRGARGGEQRSTQPHGAAGRPPNESVRNAPAQYVLLTAPRPPLPAAARPGARGGSRSLGGARRRSSAARREDLRHARPAQQPLGTGRPGVR
jgi:hypothetical protein